MRSRSEEIRQSNCNAYINCSADLYVSSLLALLPNTYTSVYSCVLFILASCFFFAVRFQVVVGVPGVAGVVILDSQKTAYRSVVLPGFYYQTGKFSVTLEHHANCRNYRSI